MRAAVAAGVVVVALAQVWGSPAPAVVATEAVAEAAAGGGLMVARWEMRVRNGAVADRSRPAHPLRLRGKWWRTQGENGSPAVRFGRRSIGRSPDRSAFDPGRAKFAFGLAFRFPRGMQALTGTDSPNLVQKGLFGSTGQWKLEILKFTGGRVQCRVIGGRRQADVVSSVRDVVRDRGWHWALCQRTDRRIILVVDGVRTSKQVRVGAVRSSAPVTVANKARSAATDQFRGIIDVVAVARGPGSLARVGAAVG
jgi:hypothetical protein